MYLVVLSLGLWAASWIMFEQSLNPIMFQNTQQMEQEKKLYYGSLKDMEKFGKFVHKNVCEPWNS